MSRNLFFQRWPAWASAALVVAACFGAAARGGTPADAPANLDFESESQDGDLPEGWSGPTTGFEGALDSKMFHGGGHSGRLRYVGDGEPEKGQYGFLTQRVKAGAFAGKKLRFAARIRTKMLPSGWTVLCLRISDADSKSLLFENMAGKAVKGTTEWTRYDIVVQTPRKADTILLGLMIGGEGTAWIDDVVLENIDHVPSGANEGDPGGGGAAAADGAAGSGNLDFESPAEMSGAPPEWKTGEGAIVVDAKVRRGGKQSVRIQLTDQDVAAKRSYTFLTQRIPAERFKGGRVRLSGFLRMKDARGLGAGLTLQVDDAKGKKLQFDDMRDRPVRNASQWKRCTVTLDVPDNAESLLFGVMLRGAGTVWVDDVTIEAVKGRKRN